ncbi:MAG: FKBP-type peptidyl-prolyl cis-trans isomerase [Bacteroidales bacterium]|nr:FKBP-type peptidyl-prolyl cis-trans isomerase [Bacteroidales bacterium]
MIKENMVVSLNYRLTRDTAQGELIEETYGQQPLTFIYGIGMMIPKFEAELTGLQQGSKFSFGVPADEAYGVNDPSMIVDLPLEIFKREGELDKEMLQVGNVLPMQDNQGNRMDGMITEMGDENLKMDFNHPLAGQDLYFTGDIVSVRQATQEELDHGHVHGEGGHHH